MRRRAILDIAGDVVSGEAVLVRVVFGLAAALLLFLSLSHCSCCLMLFWAGGGGGVEGVDSGSWTKNTLPQLL